MCSETICAVGASGVDFTNDVFGFLNESSAIVAVGQRFDLDRRRLSVWLHRHRSWRRTRIADGSCKSKLPRGAPEKHCTQFEAAQGRAVVRAGSSRDYDRLSAHG